MEKEKSNPEFSFLFIVFFPELVNTTFGVHKLLLAGVKGVADRADIELQVLLRGPGLKRFTAGAAYVSLLILGMDLLLHRFLHRRDKTTAGAGTFALPAFSAEGKHCVPFPMSVRGYCAT